MSNSWRSWASSARPKKISVSTTASIEATPLGERQTVRQRSSVSVRRCMGSEYLAFDLRKYLRRQSQTRTLEQLPVLPRGTRQSRKRLLAMLQAKGNVAHDQATKCLVELRKTLHLRHQIVFQALHAQPVTFLEDNGANGVSLRARLGFHPWTADEHSCCREFKDSGTGISCFLYRLYAGSATYDW